MTGHVFLGTDVGSASVRTGLFDAAGRRLALSVRPIAALSGHGTPSLGDANLALIPRFAPPIRLMRISPAAWHPGAHAANHYSAHFRANMEQMMRLGEAPKTQLGILQR